MLRVVIRSFMLIPPIEKIIVFNANFSMLSPRCYWWSVFVYFPSQICSKMESTWHCFKFIPSNDRMRFQVQRMSPFQSATSPLSRDVHWLPIKMKWVTCQNQLSEKTPLYSSLRIGITLSTTEIRAPLWRFVSTPVQTKMKKKAIKNFTSFCVSFA